MNRIYQGKVTNIQIQRLPSPEGQGVGQRQRPKAKQSESVWIDLPDWQSALCPLDTTSIP